ncbi:MAG TPA: hypothetical protein VFH57_06500 [Gammaproteobacteria bacterium]|nr:hypothetical protein [Gammaproteobacteria bacterium]
MISNRLSRWTLPFFGCALINFIAAQALIVLGYTWPTQSWAAPGTLIAVHLLTIGWLLLLMLGALFQFVPVMTSKMLPSQNLALATLAGVQVGLIGMIIGFVAVTHGMPRLAHCLPVGGGLVIIGVLIAIFDVGVPLVKARPLPLPGRMVLVALAFLLATVTLGLLMALALAVPPLAVYFAPLLGGGIGYHALAGLGGWFTICAIGVSYKLLPMFTLAPEERGLAGELVHYACATGFALVLLAGLAGLWYPGGVLNALELIGYGIIAAAIALYLVDVIDLYRTRRRRAIELQNKASIGAFVMLGIATTLAVVLAATGTLGSLAPVLIFLVLFGWLSGLGITQLYKIVPFLTWIGRFGQSLGRGPVPRVQDLVVERRGAPWFIVYFFGVAVAAPALFGRGPDWFRVGMAITAAATLMLMREYWRAWRGYYAAKQPATPPTSPLANKEATR